MTFAATDYLTTLNDDIAMVITQANLPEVLETACRYVMEVRSKRVRPLLVACAYQTLKATPADAVCDDMMRRACVCVEMLHGYSLVHDDMPCMDDDELRRGMPTCHRAFGEEVALLTGDVLQTLAFESLTMPLLTLRVDGAMSGQLSAIFAPRARRMVSGQMKDVLAEGKQLTHTQLQSIHNDKTGALIEAAVLMGGLCAKASDEVMAQLLEYAKALGLAFQVQDDVLDATMSTDVLGKPAGSDDKLQKSTYVRLFGVTKAAAYADSLFEHAKSQVNEIANPNPLIELANWVQTRNK